VIQIGINALSLCDGMSGGQISLKELGIEVDTYFSFEIKDTAIKTTQLNFPNTIQLGDVNKFDISMLQGKRIDLFLCGSPCQNMSLINITQKTGITGEKSSLFFKCVEIMRQVNPTYFLYENVGSMKNSDRDIFTTNLGIEPIKINAKLVSAQERNRYYWTNIPDIQQPADRGIKLSDIIDYGSKREENWSEKKTAFVERKKNSTMYVRVDGEKSLPITARGYAAWNTQFITDNGELRDLTTREYRRLQTIPDWYSFGDLSKTKITDLIGDGWTIEVIKHIFKGLIYT
jgi:site-specific DNA-cytosine methylase